MKSNKKRPLRDIFDTGDYVEARPFTEAIGDLHWLHLSSADAPTSARPLVEWCRNNRAHLVMLFDDEPSWNRVAVIRIVIGLPMNLVDHPRRDARTQSVELTVAKARYGNVEQACAHAMAVIGGRSRDDLLKASNPDYESLLSDAPTERHGVRVYSIVGGAR